MVNVTATSPYATYQGYTSAHTGTAKVAQASQQQAQTSTGSAATSVTLSEDALAAMAERDLVAVLADTHQKLATLLEEAGRTSPLQNGKLALDLSPLDQRELYAMSSDTSFSPDEREAAGLEMQRRFESALSGPAAIARVTGNYTGLYKAAAAYLDALGTEERASTEWKAGREAVTEGLKQLQAKPGTLPDLGPNDPVALYLALSETADSVAPSMPDMASNARVTLDRLYAEAHANGKMPSFNRNTTLGQYIDMSGFSSRALSSIILDGESQFTPEETRAARTVLQARSGATLIAGFEDANKSGDPTAFSQNIITAFSSLSAEERLAAGWSDKLYQAAMESYVTTSKLMDMFRQTTGNSSNQTLLSFLGK